jgi:hypothetical protein
MSRGADYFKRVMPEWPSYVRQNSDEAGTHCHQESGYMQVVTSPRDIDFHTDSLAQNVYVWEE